MNSMAGNSEVISIHALRGEGDVTVRSRKCYSRHFNPRPPWGGRQFPFNAELAGDDISIHALRGEGDYHEDFTRFLRNYHFNPRPPWGGRLVHFVVVVKCKGYFNPRPPWGGRLHDFFRLRRCDVISIHALRGEGDIINGELAVTAELISIHALRGEGDR